MKRTLVIITTMATLLSAAALPASAQTDGDGSEGAITTTLSGVQGTRAVTLVSPIAVNSVLSGLPTGNYAVTVEEIARTGTNPWSVTGRLCGPDSAITPTASDCTAHPDKLVKSGDALTTLAGADFDLSGLAVTEAVPGGSGTLAAGADADLSAARTLFSNTGQDTTLLYSEVYSSSGDVTLTPPSGTEITTYVGYFVVTLVQ